MYEEGVLVELNTKMQLFEVREDEKEEGEEARKKRRTEAESFSFLSHLRHFLMIEHRT